MGTEDSTKSTATLSYEEERDAAQEVMLRECILALMGDGSAAKGEQVAAQIKGVVDGIGNRVADRMEKPPVRALIGAA